VTSLPDFLLARVAEDEAVAREASQVQDDPPRRETAYFHLSVGAMFGSNASVECGARRLAWECEAKRELVERFRARTIQATQEDRNDDPSARAEQSALYAALRIMARPYAWHHDYDETWAA